MLFLPGKKRSLMINGLSIELCPNIDEVGNGIVLSVSGSPLVVSFSPVLEIRLKSLACDLSRCLSSVISDPISPVKTKGLNSLGLSVLAE